MVFRCLLHGAQRAIRALVNVQIIIAVLGFRQRGGVDRRLRPHRGGLPAGFDKLFAGSNQVVGPALHFLRRHHEHRRRR